MSPDRRMKRLQTWNQERLPALTTEMFERVLGKADEQANLPASIREANRRLRAAQERSK